MDPNGLDIKDLAAFKAASMVSYKPSIVENELYDSKLIFDN
jgi:hypothetical protein